MDFSCSNNMYNLIEGILDKYNLTKEILDNPSSNYANGYNNMELGLTTLLETIKEEKTVGILTDDDCDGFTSSVVMNNYLERLGIKPFVFFHEGKKHGLTEDVLENINSKNIELLIIPDASSSDTMFEELNRDIKVIILDHHLFSVDMPDNVIRINNQDPLNTQSNPNLTGAGMVYRFIQNLDKLLGINYSDMDIDLVALGQIGDSSDISDGEIRFIVNKGLNNINNKLMLTMLKDRLDRGEKVAPRDLSFEVIPYINAVTRVGTKEEKAQLYKGLSQHSSCERYTLKTKRKKNKITNKFDYIEYKFTGYDELYQELVLIKKRQNTIVDSTLKETIASVEKDGGVALAKASEEINPGITGLIASKMTTIFNKPAILLLPTDEGYAGSIRGKETVVASLKDWCESTNTFNWVQGHDNAAGCSINEDRVEELIEKAKEIETVKTLEVDYLANNITRNTIKIIYDNRKYFGGRVTYPKVGIKNKTFLKKNIQMRGEKTLVLYDEGENVDYIIFNIAEELKQELKRGFGATITVDIFGEPGINYFRGRANSQVIVNKIEKVEKINDLNFDF